MKFAMRRSGLNGSVDDVVLQFNVECLFQNIKRAPTLLMSMSEV